MVHASKDQVTTAGAGLSEAEAAWHHVPLFPQPEAWTTETQQALPPGEMRTTEVDCGQRWGGPVSAHLLGQPVVSISASRSPILRSGHGAAGVVGGLQELQLLLVLSQCLRIAA